VVPDSESSVDDGGGGNGGGGPRFATSPWGPCSATCGQQQGIQTRMVECVLVQGFAGNRVQLPDHECQGPNNSSSHTPKLIFSFPFIYFSTILRNRFSLLSHAILFEFILFRPTNPHPFPTVPSFSAMCNSRRYLFYFDDSFHSAEESVASTVVRRLLL
jgi:hypothetical protein